jgi:hypothetical protein
MRQVLFCEKKGLDRNGNYQSPKVKGAWLKMDEKSHFDS